MPLVLRLAGPLDVDRFARAWTWTVGRHPALRTAIREEQGVPVQCVCPVDAPVLTYADLCGKDPDVLPRLMNAEETTPFDLTRAPLFRAALWKARTDEYVFSLTIHHIVFDGWSYGILLDDLSQAYARDESDADVASVEQTGRYAPGDFARWQAAWLQSGVAARDLAYWQGRLEGLRPAGIPADLSTEIREPRQGRYLRMPAIGLETMSAIDAICERGQVSLFVVLSAVAALAIHVTSGAEDIGVGTIVANRRLAEFQSLVGFLVNAVVLRSDVRQREQSFVAFLRAQHEIVLEALDHQDLPFGALIEALGGGGEGMSNPFYQGMFVLQGGWCDRLRLDGITVERAREGYDLARGDYVIEMEARDGGLSGGIFYDAGRFSEPVVTRLMSAFRILLKAAATAPDASLHWLTSMVHESTSSVSLRAEAIGQGHYRCS